METNVCVCDDDVCVSEATSGGLWRRRRRNDVSDLLRSKGLMVLHFAHL